MKNDFSTGNVKKNILLQALPLILAQAVQLLYNIIDRIYIGHLPEIGSMALTGVGLAFPLTTLIAAFTQMYMNGGVPLFSIARGAKEEKQAEKVLSQVFMWLFVTSILLFIVCYIFKKPILYLFGASDASYGYAESYLKIYLLGTLFVVMTTGLNGFINAQGYPQIGMGSVLIGAVVNIILDPLFIFAFHMGVSGAALATVIAQAASFVWAMSFFFGKKNAYRITLKNMIPDFRLFGEIASLGMSGFIMQGTNCAVQVVCNVTLRAVGGDLFVGVMTIINSLREVLSLPVNGLTTGGQPVLSYNYGAKRYKLVKKGIRFMGLLGIVYTAAAWILVLIFPKFLMSIFTTDQEMILAGVRCIQIYFFGFIFMTLQFIGQSSFTAMKCTKRAIFFSLFRKAIIVIPLTILLPKLPFLKMATDGVFAAEPISNLVGGLACVLTMYFTLYRTLGKGEVDETPEGL